MWIEKAGGAGVDGLAYAPDGKTLFVAVGDGWLDAWDLATRTKRRLVRIRDEHRSAVHRLVVTADGRFLVAVQSRVSVACEVASGRDYRVGEVWWPRAVSPMPGFDARFAVLNRECGGIGFWDVAEGREGPTAFPWWQPRSAPLLSFDLAPDGTALGVLWETGVVTYVGTGEGAAVVDVRPPHPGGCWGVRFSPDGGTLFLLGAHPLTLWDVRDRRERARVVIPSAFDGTFACNPTQPVFATRNASRELTLFRLETGEPIRSLDFALGRAVRCVCFSPDGLTCAVGGSNRQFAVFDVDV